MTPDKMMTLMAISNGESKDSNDGKDNNNDGKGNKDGEDTNNGKDDDCGGGSVPAQKTTINQMRQQKKWHHRQ
jgi:hypothetical protein